MTRGKNIPRRLAFHKFVRQKAHQEGTLFVTAASNTVWPAGLKATYSSDHYYSRHGRKDGKQLSSGDFIHGSDADTGELSFQDEDVHDFKIDFTDNDDDTQNTRRHTDMTISLLDIARPAKQKGVAKDFEVVQTVRNVIVLEDEFESLVGFQWEDDNEWEQWEEVYDGRHAEQARSYSSVLRGNET